MLTVATGVRIERVVPQCEDRSCSNARDTRGESRAQRAGCRSHPNEYHAQRKTHEIPSARGGATPQAFIAGKSGPSFRRFVFASHSPRVVTIVDDRTSSEETRSPLSPQRRQSGVRAGARRLQRARPTHQHPSQATRLVRCSVCRAFLNRSRPRDMALFGASAMPHTESDGHSVPAVFTGMGEGYLPIRSFTGSFTLSYLSISTFTRLPSTFSTLLI